MNYHRRSDGKFVVYFDTADFLDPETYETSENDPLSEREEARINRIVWGKKIYLQPIILEGTFRKE